MIAKTPRGKPEKKKGEKKKGAIPPLQGARAPLAPAVTTVACGGVLPAYELAGEMGS
jgi:hypothetical protein